MAANVVTEHDDDVRALGAPGLLRETRAREAGQGQDPKEEGLDLVLGHDGREGVEGLTGRREIGRPNLPARADRAPRCGGLSEPDRHALGGSGLQRRPALDSPGRRRVMKTRMSSHPPQRRRTHPKSEPLVTIAWQVSRPPSLRHRTNHHSISGPHDDLQPVTSEILTGTAPVALLSSSSRSPPSSPK